MGTGDIFRIYPREPGIFLLQKNLGENVTAFKWSKKTSYPHHTQTPLESPYYVKWPSCQIITSSKDVWNSTESCKWPVNISPRGVSERNSTYSLSIKIETNAGNDWSMGDKLQPHFKYLGNEVKTKFCLWGCIISLDSYWSNLNEGRGGEEFLVFRSKPTKYLVFEAWEERSLFAVLPSERNNVTVFASSKV